jgi:hypothetical protein
MPFLLGFVLVVRLYGVRSILLQYCCRLSFPGINLSTPPVRLCQVQVLLVPGGRTSDIKVPEFLPRIWHRASYKYVVRRNTMQHHTLRRRGHTTVPVVLFLYSSTVQKCKRSNSPTSQSDTVYGRKEQRTIEIQARSNRRRISRKISRNFYSNESKFSAAK